MPESRLTIDNFDEEYYLHANPDVAAAVRSGDFLSGGDHFWRYGRHEGRRGSRPVDLSFGLASEQLRTGLDALHQRVDALDALLRQHVETLTAVRREIGVIDTIARAQYDDLTASRRLLMALRDSPCYTAMWNNPEPIVSVVIPTWNRAEMLADRAIASVRRQTYSKLDIVVVGDHCTDDTQTRLERLGDARIRFYNLPYRSVYPSDPHHKWLVAGSQSYNVAVELAKGEWIAPLDDDDLFTDDHIEVLLATALSERREMVYGRLHRYWADTNEWDEVGSYPPAIGNFTLQGAFYLKALSFFALDPRCWVVNEPNDWNLMRRMLETGVSIGYVERFVGTLVTSHYDAGSDDERSRLHQQLPARATTAQDEPNAQWLSHARSIPGWTTDEEAGELLRVARALPREAVVVEVGSFLGRSTIFLAEARRLAGSGRVHCVDPFDGSGDVFSVPVYRSIADSLDRTLKEEFEHNVAQAGVSDVVSVHVGKAVDVAKQWTSPIDMLFMDGDQSRAGVHAAFEAWLPFLKPGAIVAIHASTSTEEHHDGSFMLASSDLDGPGWIEKRLVGTTTFVRRASAK